jgi:hypothetical protein
VVVFDVFVALIPAAIGVALSPAGIIELILVLLSKRAKLNGIVFLLTLWAGVFVVPLVGAFVVDAVTSDDGSAPSATKGWVLLFLGALLLLLAFRNFRNRRDTSEPKVFGAIAEMGPFPVFVLAVGVTVFNPKNLAMLLAAGTNAGGSGASTAEIVVALVLFTLLATSPFIVAVGMLVLGGEGAEAGLVRMKEWLIEHNRLIMAIVLAVLGLVLVGQAIPAIVS